MSTLSKGDMMHVKRVFNSFDEDNSGSIDIKEMNKALQNLELFESEASTAKLMAEVDLDSNGVIDWDEFVNVVKSAKGGSGFKKVYSAQSNLIEHKGKTGTHAFSQGEVDAYASHLNYHLASDDDIKHLMPIESGTGDLFEKVKDGLLVSKFINIVEPDTIDIRALNTYKGQDLSKFKANENHSLNINACKGIGISTTNVGGTELYEGAKYPHIVLGLMWQLLKKQLLSKINLNDYPELVRLLEDGETLAEFQNLKGEDKLLRWLNWHLKRSGSKKRVKNFTNDVKDSEAYTLVLHELSPNRCTLDPLSEEDTFERAQMCIDNAAKLGVPEGSANAQEISKGNPRINLSFVAALFNANHGLPSLDDEELNAVDLFGDDDDKDPLEAAFRNWINSLGLDDNIRGLKDTYVNYPLWGGDLYSGLILLLLIDHIEPGIVDWKKKVEMNPNNKFKCVINNNYAIKLGKEKLKLSLVGIGGQDIVSGNRKLILGFIWQLMRYHVIKYLAEVNKAKFGEKKVTDNMIVDWANEKVASSGKSSSIKSFKDPSIKTGVFFLDLLYASDQKSIKAEYVTEGLTDEDALSNAKYAVSVARRLGAALFLVPQDIVTVKPKLVMVMISTIMALKCNQ